MSPWLTRGRLLPGLTVRRLLTATPAARPLNKTMSAETAEHAGTPQSKLLVMENIKKFPRGINSDQVISLTLADGCNGSVHPGPGLNLLAGSSDPVHGQQPPLESGATSLKLQATSSERFKLQAASIKPQAQRFKRQAASGKLLDHGSWKKFQGTRIKGLYQDK